MPDLLIEPAWPQGYRPSFLPSHAPGPVVRTLGCNEFAAAKGAGMAGVHRREGIFIAYGEGLPAMEVPTLDIAQAGAVIYPLLGRPIPGDIETRLPPYLMELLDAQRAPNDQAEWAHAEAYSPQESFELTERLAAMGYI